MKQYEKTPPTKQTTLPTAHVLIRMPMALSVDSHNCHLDTGFWVYFANYAVKSVNLL